MTTATEQSIPWFLYMLRCADGSLYTGISTDVQRRLAEHGGEAGARGGRSNKGAKALRGRSPLQLVLTIPLANKSEALKLEYRVKRLDKARKEMLVRGEIDAVSLLEPTDQEG